MLLVGYPMEDSRTLTLCRLTLEHGPGVETDPEKFEHDSADVFVARLIVSVMGCLLAVGVLVFLSDGALMWNNETIDIF